MIIEMLAKQAHFLLQGSEDRRGASLAASDAADEGRIDAEAAGDAAEEAAKNGELRERRCGIIRLVTIHDAFREHGSLRATPDS